ncbi:MAG: hypothetical protein ACREQQ_15175 [Candidatus Binatia bacterium]
MAALVPAAMAQPANDDCANATVIDDPTCVGFEESIDTTTATTEVGEPAATCGGSPHGATIWYQFTSAITRQVRIETSENSFDTVIQVFSGSCGATMPIACNDDGGSDSLSSLVTFVAEAGVPYLIRVGTFDNGAGGTAVFGLDCPQPSNDDCANASVIDDATCAPFADQRDTTEATTEVGEPAATCGDIHGATVWYQLTTSITRQVRIATEGSDYDTVVQVYSGSCGATVPVACDDDSGPGNQSFLTFTAQAGVAYLVRVGSFAQTEGGNLNLLIDCRLCAESGRGGGGTLLLDPIDGTYDLCCNSGALQPGTAVLTQQGACRLGFDDSTGGERVLGSFDLCRNTADASFQSPVPVTQCVIADQNTRDNGVCDCDIP